MTTPSHTVTHGRHTHADTTHAHAALGRHKRAAALRPQCLSSTSLGSGRRRNDCHRHAGHTRRHKHTLVTRERRAAPASQKAARRRRRRQRSVLKQSSTLTDWPAARRETQREAPSALPAAPRAPRHAGPCRPCRRGGASREPGAAARAPRLAQFQTSRATKSKMGCHCNGYINASHLHRRGPLKPPLICLNSKHFVYLATIQAAPPPSSHK